MRSGDPRREAGRAAREFASRFVRDPRKEYRGTWRAGPASRPSAPSPKATEAHRAEARSSRQMIETRRAGRIRPLGLVPSSSRADVPPEGREVLTNAESAHR